MPLRQPICRKGRNLGVTEALLIGHSFFGASMSEASGNEKAVSRNAQGGVMVQTLPVPSLVMRQAELLLEFLIVPLNAPGILVTKSK